MALRTRKNVATIGQAMRDRYVAAVLKMKATPDANFGNVYDKYPILHLRQGVPSTAHQNVQFFSWHRVFLWLFENDLREADRVARGATDVDEDFTLPYWNWTNEDSADGAKTRGVVWKEDFMGPTGRAADTIVDKGSFKTGNWTNAAGAPDTSLQRELGVGGSLPTVSQVGSSMDLQDFDQLSMDGGAPNTSFRNVVEGWVTQKDKTGTPPLLHNAAHVWVGGTMGTGASPNDPVFFMHHANIDRIWATWQQLHQRGVQQFPEADIAAAVALGNTFALSKTVNMPPWDGSEARTAERWKTEDVLDLRNIKASGNGYVYDAYPGGLRPPGA